MRAAISRIDKEQLVSVSGDHDARGRRMGGDRPSSLPRGDGGAFAALAVMLAMVGVFGILAYSVQQRMRDFGVRRALGATTSDVMRLVVGNALQGDRVGASSAWSLSAAFGRLITTMLFGVQPLDFATFALVTVVLGLTTALSIAGPAWRAARIDPAVALRSK